MVELCLMASSSTFPHGGFHPEQGFHHRNWKEFQSFTPSLGTSLKMVRPDCLKFKSDYLTDPWKPIGRLSDSNQFSALDLAIEESAVIDVQDESDSNQFSKVDLAMQETAVIGFRGSQADSVLHRYEIPKQHGEFFISRSSEEEGEKIEFSLLTEPMGLQTLAMRMNPQPLVPMNDEVGLYESQPSLIYPSNNFFAPKSLLDFVGDLSSNSRLIMHPDGRVLFTGTGVEMKDLISIISEYHLFSNSTKKAKEPMLVPYFDRKKIGRARKKGFESSLKLEAVTIAPAKSPKKSKLKQSLAKKTSRKAGKESDIHRRSNLHACESLLSLILGRRQGKTPILSLKKSGPELPQLLTQFSATIAGTGLAVVFTVLCNVSSGRVPFCTSKMMSTGFGFGLVWLSWAVNKLRDSIIYISKNQTKLGLKEEEMMKRVDTSMNEIFFRVATLMAVAVLKFALRELEKVRQSKARSRDDVCFSNLCFRV